MEGDLAALLLLRLLLLLLLLLLPRGLPSASTAGGGCCMRGDAAWRDGIAKCRGRAPSMWTCPLTAGATRAACGEERKSSRVEWSGSEGKSTSVDGFSSSSARASANDSPTPLRRRRRFHIHCQSGRSVNEGDDGGDGDGNEGGRRDSGLQVARGREMAALCRAIGPPFPPSAEPFPPVRTRKPHPPPDITCYSLVGQGGDADDDVAEGEEQNVASGKVTTCDGSAKREDEEEQRCVDEVGSKQKRRRRRPRPRRRLANWAANSWS
ncbi:hypothetical protein BDZ90DRAFT_275875 [Jaminaea rosea]|uniref:Ig-like domain-containing protein n=1 Tax=Jaminaea rosea TaxID=1569628 RepID=A0A316UQ59_9BASI|nr:hypothetical protein BDZ90DRAFT_275875 [Jaminaea rosea]PWN25275.1 hypothetical protein BDZ90DRAFT_275875 [Jaminaea rosea]